MNFTGVYIAYKTNVRVLAQLFNFLLSASNDEPSASVPSHGAYSIRGGLVLSYDHVNARDQVLRTRCQELAFQIIDHLARAIEEYIALNIADQTDARSAEAPGDEALLDQMSDLFFFSVGAPEVRKGEEPRALGDIDCRKRYLADNDKTFRRVGDVGMPKTIYYM